MLIWNLVYLSQNIWRGQIGLKTQICGQFLHFDMLNHLLIYHENFKFDAHYREIGLF